MFEDVVNYFENVLKMLKTRFTRVLVTAKWWHVERVSPCDWITVALFKHNLCNTQPYQHFCCHDTKLSWVETTKHTHCHSFERLIVCLDARLGAYDECKTTVRTNSGMVRLNTGFICPFWLFRKLQDGELIGLIDFRRILGLKRSFVHLYWRQTKEPCSCIIVFALFYF